MRIYMNQKFAKKGTRSEAETCPVALLLKKKLKKAVAVCAMEVDVTARSGLETKVIRKFVPSNKLAKAIIAYDNGKGFPSGHYSLRQVPADTVLTGF